jgi:retinol dehydrogenase-12
MSKLLDVFMAREIAQLPAAQKVNVNSLNPGLCVSELRRDMPIIVAK